MYTVLKNRNSYTKGKLNYSKDFILLFLTFKTNYGILPVQIAKT